MPGILRSLEVRIIDEFTRVIDFYLYPGQVEY